MIYKLPIANGINVSDTNQKTENLNGLSVLPMVDCTGVEYNGTISGWSRKFRDYQAQTETGLPASSKAVYNKSDILAVSFNEDGDGYKPKINDEIIDYNISTDPGNISGAQRVFYPADVIDKADKSFFLKTNPGQTKLIFEDTLNNHTAETTTSEPFYRARFIVGGNDTNGFLQYNVVAVGETAISYYNVTRSASGISVAKKYDIPIGSDETKNFADLFISYKADVYSSDTVDFYVCRNDPLPNPSDENCNIVTHSGSAVYKYQSGDLVSVAELVPGQGFPTVYAPFFKNGEIYFSEIIHIYPSVGTGFTAYCYIKKVNKSGDVAELDMVTLPKDQTAKDWISCWSEFEFYCDNERYYRSGGTTISIKHEPAGIAGSTELTGITENGLYAVSTLNGIPVTLDIDDLYICGLEGCLLTAFPAASGRSGEQEVCFYHSSGRIAYFDLQKIYAQSAIDGSAFGALDILARATKQVKNGICKLFTDKQPIFFDYENRKPLYGCMGYTGAIEAPLSVETVSDSDYMDTGFAAVMTNEIANTIGVSKVLPVHNDVVSGKVSVKRRAPKFSGTSPRETDPIFSFWCSETVTYAEDGKGIRTTDIKYQYDFSYTRKKIDIGKVGREFPEAIYNTLFPLPAWAQIREDNPRVADGGNVTFFCATNPESQYRGLGSIGYCNYYAGSSFDNLESYLFIGGKHFIQQEESLMELNLDVKGAIVSVGRYLEKVKFDFIGQSQSEGYFLSRADKTLYRYTGYYQMIAQQVFSNFPGIGKGQYLSTMNAVLFYPEGDLTQVYFMRGGNVSRLICQGYNNDAGEAETPGKIVYIQEGEKENIYLYNANDFSQGEIPQDLNYLDYALQKPAGYKQQAFSLDSSYIGIPYTELQVFSVALTFYVELEEGDEIPVRLRYKWRYAESAGSEEADFVIKYDETESDPNGRRFVRFRFIPAVQKVVDFALGISVPNLEKDVTVQSVEFAGVDIEATQKDKPLIGERWSR